MLNFERIELQGFKSFADKVKIELLDGITGIVGPNGCGKSNVADAIKWVLGEQSAKTMRGTSMQDVIFNGTEKRKSLSYCEVSLYFNNSEKIFSDLDFSEVVMTRKLYRSGESEYFLNKQPCRLKDIIDALHSCGVSKDGYTVIEQGKVTEIFSAKPEDRRAIFEEAVGISKTKRDRKETMAKLARTGDNITRVNDIITERERQLEPLKKQADKTRAFRGLSEKLKYNVVNAYVYKYENANDIKEKINEKIKGYGEELLSKKRDLEAINADYQRFQNEIASADRYIKELNDKIYDKGVSIEKSAGNAKVFAERITYFKSENQRLQGEIASAKEKLETLNADVLKKSDYAENCSSEIEELNVKAEEISKKLTVLSAEISSGETSARIEQSRILKSVEGLADINKNIGSLSTEQNVITVQQKGIIEKVNGLVDKYNAIDYDLKRSQNDLKKMESDLADVKEAIKDKELSVAQNNEFLSKINSKIYALNNKISADEAGLKFYQGLKNSFDGYAYGVKKIMHAAGVDGEVAKRVKGTVASVISTEKEYELAIETAIGGAMQNIVVDNADDARYLIDYLKRTDGGRVTFLPVSTVKPRYNGSELRSALKENGAIGLATELVKYNPYYENVVSFLLGGTLIARDLQSATEIAKKYRFAFKIVTLGADVLSSSGSMTGGSQSKNNVSLLSVDRTVNEYAEVLKADKIEFERLDENRKRVTGQVNTLIEELDDLTAKQGELKQKYAALKESVEFKTSALKDAEDEIEKNRDEIAIISARLEQIKTAYSDIETGGEKLNKEREDAASLEKEHQERFTALREERDALLDENTEIQSKISFYRAEIAAAESDKERMHGEIRDLTFKNANDEEVITGNLNIIDGLKREAEKVALSKDEQDELNRMRSELKSFDEKKVELNEKLNKANEARDVLQTEIDRSADRKAAEEVNLTKVDSDLEHMSETIFNEYQLDYNSCKPLKDEAFDIKAGEEEINSLKRKIQMLGSVNPAAIDEYEELNGAYLELVSQRDDLEKAKADLEKVITDLTKEMALTFDEGFKTIRQNFSQVFKELFGGGNADLVIEESETGDPLDAGIEIIAQPPGKKLQKISLLSGGEKSFTAIAILFAILKLRPMPFVVLDEIEAALDDANVERFASYLKNFSKETQFICITHKKITMEHANGLFGVTMPEKGVSSIVSINYGDIEKYGDFE